MRTRSSWIALLATFLVPAVPAHAADHTVAATNSNVFTPADVTVLPGDSVTWNNSGGFHNVRFDDGSFDMPLDPIDSAWSVARTFHNVGVFRYYCEAHGDLNGVGMAGTVSVQAAGTPAPPPSPATPQQVSADKTSPALKLSGSTRQKVLRQGAIFVRVEVDEASRVVGRARVSIPRTGRTFRTTKPARQLVPGKPSTLKLELSKKALRSFRRALRKHTRLTARVTVTARDSAGNRTVIKRRVKLKA